LLTAIFHPQAAYLHIPHFFTTFDQFPKNKILLGDCQLPKQCEKKEKARRSPHVDRIRLFGFDITLKSAFVFCFYGFAPFVSISD
jgi:hypothetical protein